MIAAGPLARTASPRNIPKQKAAKGSEDTIEEERDVPGGTSRTTAVAKTIATVSIAEKGISVAAAWEKPIIATVVGSRRSSQRAVSSPYNRHANQASASVASRAATAQGRRAAAS